MKTLFVFLIVATSIFSGLPGCTVEKRKEEQQVQVNLLSTPWAFHPLHAAQSVLTPQAPSATFGWPGDTTFTVVFGVNFKTLREETVILEIPEILSVVLRNHDANDRKHQNYPAFKMPDGSVPVIEAGLSLQLPVEDRAIRKMPAGIPLAMLENPYGEHEIVLHFSGVCWTMYVDGELLDNDFPLGYPVWENTPSWKINPGYVSKAEIYFPGINPVRIPPDKPRRTPEIQYWSPEGHNTWVGDVATFYKDGRYHVFYLFDRRTHGSKFGRGAHYFEHLSTTDFKTWTEHEAATPIEEQWETFGTGTPFLSEGKLCLSYGLHTTRIYPPEMTALPVQWKYYRKNGYTGSFRMDTTTGYPAGSSYSVSEDGIANFRKTGILFHPCENPSVYTDPGGKLRMLANYGAKGAWGSESIDGGWHCIDSVFPPGGDCTFFFRWGDYDYIIGGFEGFWSKPAGEQADRYTDAVKQGLDLYNGMSVPAVTEIGDNRFLLAGWIAIHGWGGVLCIHEPVQLANGRIGVKWMEEIIPQTANPQVLQENLSGITDFDVNDPSFLLTFEVHPAKEKSGRLSLTFLSGNGEQNACELLISPDEKSAQYGNGAAGHFAEKEKSLRQGAHPQAARNYAVENLMDVDRPFTVRLIVKATDKYGGSLIDTEIAGKRTMITYRPDLFVKQLIFRPEQVEVKNITLAKLSGK